MPMSMMHKRLLKLCADAEKEGKAGIENLVITFTNGQTIPGVLRVETREGEEAMFELAIGGMVGNPGERQTPSILRHHFESSAVLYFMQHAPIEQPRVLAVGAGGLIVPAG